MSFTRQVFTPKQAYDAADHAEADAVLAKRVIVEPRCNSTSAYCLHLRGRGEFVHYSGVGPDAGKTLYVSFITKAVDTVRLIYFAPDGFANHAEILETMSKAVKDALQGQVISVYWYVKANDPASTDKSILSGLAAQVADDWPSLKITTTTPHGFTRWEVSQ